MEIGEILNIVAISMFTISWIGLIVMEVNMNRIDKKLKRSNYDLEVLERLTAIEDRIIDIKEEVHEQEIEQL